MSEQTPPPLIPTEPIITLPNNIVIRPYKLTDVPSLSHHGSDKAIWDQLRNRMPHPYTEADAAFWITDNTNNPSKFVATGPWDPEKGSTGPKIPTSYVIEVDGRAVGSIGLMFGEPWDVYARTAEIGYWLGQAYWGKGISKSERLPDDIMCREYQLNQSFSEQSRPGLREMGVANLWHTRQVELRGQRSQSSECESA